MCARAVALLGFWGEGSGRSERGGWGWVERRREILGFRGIVEVDLRGRFEDGDFESRVVGGGSFGGDLRFLAVVLGELMAFSDAVLGRFLEGDLVGAGRLFVGELFAPLLSDRDLVCTILAIASSCKMLCGKQEV